MKKIKILFIGNSHTYYNDLPAIVAKEAKKDDYDCEVTMIAHGGWFLEQHALEPDVRFNIQYGQYDYVVLQEHSHPFAEEERYLKAVGILDEWIKKAGSKTVIYETWAKKEEPFLQEHMSELQESAARKTGALLASVGRKWWQYKQENPEVEMYYEDGAHASFDGSCFAAGILWKTIKENIFFEEDTKNQDRNLLAEGYQEGDIVRIEFEDGEVWEQGIVVDNEFGRLVIRNLENEFAIAYPEVSDFVQKIEE